MASLPDPDVLRWCDRLGLTGVHDVHDVVRGRSGAHVVSLAATSGRVVLKITTDPARLDRARREVDVLRQLARHPSPVAPDVRGSASTGDAVAVALQELAPLPPTHELGDHDWVDVAVAVAGVHSTPPLAALGLVGRPRHGPLPAVLEHGDCHLDNLVRDTSGRVLLLDWQEARLGDGLADLVFLWQRAEFAGHHPPREAMTVAYAGARGLDVPALAPLLDRAELRLLREEWPPFLALGDEAGRAAMGRRRAALEMLEPPGQSSRRR